MKRILLATAVLGLANLQIPQVRAGWILVFAPEVIFGDPVIIDTVEKTGTATAVLRSPAGIQAQDGPNTVNFPGTARAQVELPGAIAGAKAVTRTQRASHGWAVLSGQLPGWSGAGTEAHFNERLISRQVVQTVTSIRMHPTWIRDPNQIDDAYFGPDTDSMLEYDLSLRELTTGFSFDSTSNITPQSSDTFTDDTGMITWVRRPGLFGGIEDIGMGDLPNEFSNNRWEIETSSVQIDMPDITLQPGEGLDLTFEFSLSSSGSATSSGTGLFGISSIPEPGSIMLFGLGSLGIVGYAWRRRRRVSQRPQSYGTPV